MKYMTTVYWVVTGIVLIAVATFIIWYAPYIESQKKDREDEKYKKDQTHKIDSIKDGMEGINKAVLQIKVALGLDENTQFVLKSVLGDDYETKLKDKETVNELINQLMADSPVEVIERNKSLEKQIEEFEIIKNTEFKEEILLLLESYKYESIRILITNYIREKDNIEPKFLSQLYFFMSVTFSYKDSNLEKKGEYITKAMDLNPDDANTLRHFGKYLNILHDKEAVKVLEKAIKLVKNGSEIEPWEYVSLLISLGNAHFHMELNKSKSNRDFTSARDYFSQAIKINTKLDSGHSQLYIINRDLSRIEVESNNYERAIELLNESIELEKKIIGKGFFSRHTAFAFLNLGNCYSKLIHSRKELELNREVLPKAREAYLNSLNLFIHFFNPNHIHVSTVLSNLGNLEKIAGNTGTAITHYQESLRIAESYEVRLPHKLAISHANLCRAYAKKMMEQKGEQRQGVKNEAILHSEKAFSLS